MELLPLAATAMSAGGTVATAAGVGGTLASTMATAGTILSAVGSVVGGIGKKNEANFEADQMKQQAGQERASSQRKADEERKQKVYAESRSQALAAASGGGAADPTVVDTTGQLEQEGKYRELNALYEGEDRARGLEAGASAKQLEGRNALTAGLIQGVGTGATILSGATSLLDKYATKKRSSTYYPGSNTWVDWNRA
jgi:hypothetical protein